MTFFIDDIYCYIEKYLEEFLIFCESKSDEKPAQKLAQFIEFKGQPFNMQDYMAVQTNFINKYLERLSEACDCSESKQKAVKVWLEEEAQNFRNSFVRDQAQMIRELDHRIEKYIPDGILDQFRVA